MKCRRGIPAVFLLFGTSLTAGEPSSDVIGQAVADLVSTEFEMRQAAYGRLLDLGVAEPDRVLAALPAETSDQDEELKAAFARLRQRVPVEGVRRRLHALIGDAEPGALHPRMAREKLIEGVDLFFDAPSPRSVRLLSGIFRVPPPEIADAIFLFRASPDPAMRCAVMATLGRIDTVRARELAVAYLDDPDPAVRAQAVGSAAQLAGREALVLLEPRLNDPKREVCLAAIHAITGMGPAAVPPLRRFAEKQFVKEGKGMDRLLASHALTALVQLKDRESAPFLAALTDQFDLTVRATAIQGLGELGDKRFASRIAAHLEDPEAFIRNASARGLAFLSGDDALRKACADQMTMTLEDQIFFFVGKEEDLQLGGGAEGIRPDEKAIAAARAWWEARKDDPEFRPGK